MIIAKGRQVHRLLRSRSYSWKSAGFIFLAWSAMTLPFIVSACDEVACEWSPNVGWWADLLHQLSPFDSLGAGTTVTVVLITYMVLTIYFLGHCLGWMLYGTKRLLRFAV
ncbi:hypothetical protein [Sinorhizobium terangae]|uniref:Uncharacterized protein n=1 Tax=Sinorhizobium terangae TaxID=110322 RepID=A0A6N7LC06_SINTE|nr:hypothetical protein [Sinorhizobium terangae]MQX15381.1 hypothetical protein [Sinorhizobium terangae]WFU49528.1 hypothetical protein QA637_09085 [Sinorhizobium terangae]